MKKDGRIDIRVTQQEMELIKERMDVLGINNMSAYIRKMAINGYIVHLDLSDVKEMVRLLGYCSNNLNQYARMANETGAIYAADIADLKRRLEQIWDAAGKVLSGLAKVP